MNNMIEAIRNLDVGSINYMLTSEKIGIFSKNNKNYISPAKKNGVFNVLLKLKKFSTFLKSRRGKFFSSIRLWLTQEHTELLVYAVTKNQYDALKDVLPNLRSSYSLVTTMEWIREPNLLFPTHLSVLMMPLFIPKVYLDQYHKRGSVRKMYSRAFIEVLRSYTDFVLWYIFLNRVQPQQVLLANDHSRSCRCLLSAAKILSIPTSYVQHASVTSKFPPLTFDYALLEGEDALIKYDQAGFSPSRVYLVGMPKSDRFHIHEGAMYDKLRVGICMNLFDKIEDIEKLAVVLTEDSSRLSLLIRPHPRTPLSIYNQLQRLANDKELEISDSRKCSVDRFIRDIDIVVAGDSSIHLESIVSNRETIYYTQGRSPGDPYGYLAHNLVTYSANTIESVKKCIEQLRSKGLMQSRERGKYYIDTIDGPCDGASSKLTAQLLDGLICGSDEIRWEPVEGVELSAYRLSKNNLI